MDNKYDILIKEFERNILKLIDENDVLKAKNESLKNELRIKQQDLMEAHKELIESNTAYSDLLSTNTLNGTTEEQKKFKEFLQELVIEIDNSMALI